MVISVNEWKNSLLIFYVLFISKTMLLKFPIVALKPILTLRQLILVYVFECSDIRWIYIKIAISCCWIIPFLIIKWSSYLFVLFLNLIHLKKIWLLCFALHSICITVLFHPFPFSLYVSLFDWCVSCK